MTVEHTMALLKIDSKMNKILDEAKWRKEAVDGYVMANFLRDPRVIKDELNIHDLHSIDQILTFIKQNAGQIQTVYFNVSTNTSSKTTNEGPRIINYSNVGGSNYIIKNKDDLRKHLIENSFDYMEDGRNQKGKVVFRENNTANVDGEGGSWEVTSKTEFFIYFRDEDAVLEFTYEFKNNDYT